MLGIIAPSASRKRQAKGKILLAWADLEASSDHIAFGIRLVQNCDGAVCGLAFQDLAHDFFDQYFCGLGQQGHLTHSVKDGELLLGKYKDCKKRCKKQRLRSKKGFPKLTQAIFDRLFDCVRQQVQANVEAYPLRRHGCPSSHGGLAPPTDDKRLGELDWSVETRR
jgi:hypothetical protein